MWELLKELLREETKLVVKHRAKGKVLVKPSSVVAIIFALLYLLSPIDIIPEAWIHPSAFGYIDDIIVIALVAVYVYGDIGGVILNAKVQPERVSEHKPTIEPDVISSQVRSDDDMVSIPTAVDHISSTDPIHSFSGSFDVSSDPVGSDTSDDQQVVVAGSKSTEDLFNEFFGGVDRDKDKS